jgi:acetyl esterase/lipase
MESFVGWARLVAASGMVAVLYGTGGDPSADCQAVLAHLRAHAESLGIDARRIGIWACSGHAPTALAPLMTGAVQPTCAVLCYPYLLDEDGESGVADAARTFHFATPCAGRRVDDVAAGVPLLIVRAGADAMPALNAGVDRFAARALARNLPIAVVNHAAGPHAFDLLDDSDASRAVIRIVLAFLRAQLRPDSVGL